MSIRVEVDDGGAPARRAADDYHEDFSPANPAFSGPSDDLWSTGEPAPPPIDRRELTPEPASRRRAADFSEQFIEFPGMQPAGGGASPFGSDPFAEPAGARNPFAEPYVPPPAPPTPRPAAPPVYQETPAPAPVRPAPPPPAAAPPQQMPMPASGESFGSGGPSKASVAEQQFAAQPVPVPVPPAARGAPSDADQQALMRFIQGLAAGAGVGPEVFSGRDPGEVGFEVGEYMRVAAEQLAQLLRARAAAKAMTKSASRTMVGATDNNPLKFIPTASEAIDVMFSRRRPGYLGQGAAWRRGSPT